jgi:hypothetical protein
LSNGLETFSDLFKSFSDLFETFSRASTASDWSKGRRMTWKTTARLWGGEQVDGAKEMKQRRKSSTRGYLYEDFFLLAQRRNDQAGARFSRSIGLSAFPRLSQDLFEPFR